MAKRERFKRAWMLRARSTSCNINEFRIQAEVGFVAESTYQNESDIQFGNDVNISGDVDTDKTEQLDPGVGKDSDDGINVRCDIS